MTFFRKEKLLFIITLYSSSFSSYVVSMESLSIQPGSRAMAMAGVFSAQADDSSAIWYNPSALIHYDYIKQDFTFEVGQRSFVADTNKNNRRYNTEIFPKYIAYYSRTKLKINGKYPMGIGLSYFSAYKNKLNINVAKSLVTDVEFGDVEVNSHQISSMINLNISKVLSLGGTVDFLWMRVDCLEYEPCVDNGPTGIGATLGGLYEIINHSDYVIKLGAVWRTSAKMSYLSTPSSGIGTVLSDYTPDRPDSKHVSISLQMPTPWFLMNSNLMLEQVAWSKTVNRGQSLSDYQNIGASVELMSFFSTGNAFATRTGVKLINNKTTGDLDAVVTAFGFGYELKKSHMIDIAYEFRKIRSTADIGSWSISYSWQ